MSDNDRDRQEFETWKRSLPFGQGYNHFEAFMAGYQAALVYARERKPGEDEIADKAIWALNRDLINIYSGLSDKKTAWAKKLSDLIDYNNTAQEGK